METDNIFDVIKFITLSLISFDSDYLYCKKDQSEFVGSGLSELKQAAEEEGIDTNEVMKSLGGTVAKELFILIKDIKDTVIRYCMIIVMFFLHGSIYPALPLFGILAGMFAFIKYFMFKFRKF